MQCYNAVIQHLILKVDTTNTETVTRSERHEEDAFLDEVMNSDVMKETMRCRQIILDIIFNKTKIPRPQMRRTIEIPGFWQRSNFSQSQQRSSKSCSRSSGSPFTAEATGSWDQGWKKVLIFNNDQPNTVGLSMCSWVRRSLGKFR